jgi:serine/threonine kinase PknH
VEGTPFGRYRLIKLLGRGGMGEVWRAHDTDTDRIVAIKLLPAHFSEDEDFQRRFRREAHAAARLNTPHVVPIHHYGEIDGRLYVDMRLIEGRDLETVLAEGPMEPMRAVRIIEGVALALHAAHEVGLLHRDVKPSNILLDRNDFAYLIDFGIARAVDETRMTKSGNTIGTFQYIAPERLGSRAEEDARADIYSLACVLYECLTGHPPFDEATMAGLVAAHLNTPPPQPSTTQPNLPAQMDPVIATGMAKDPDKRYATTVELANAAHDAITTPLAPPSEPTLLDNAPPATPTPAPTLLDAWQQPADLHLAATQQRPPDDGDGWPYHLQETQPADHRPPETATPTPQPWWQRQRQQVKVALIAATVVILAAAGITGFLLRQPSTISQPSTASQQVTPVAEASLEGLLLSPDQINTAMGATGMTVSGASTAMIDYSAQVSDKARMSRVPWIFGGGPVSIRLRSPGHCA